MLTQTLSHTTLSAPATSADLDRQRLELVQVNLPSARAIVAILAELGEPLQLQGHSTAALWIGINPDAGHTLHALLHCDTGNYRPGRRTYERKETLEVTVSAAGADYWQGRPVCRLVWTDGALDYLDSAVYVPGDWESLLLDLQPRAEAQIAARNQSLETARIERLQYLLWMD
mgnify:CR=1 FL=1